MENNNSSLGTLSAHTNFEVEGNGFDADKLAKDLLRQHEEELREFMKPIYDREAEVKAMIAKHEEEIQNFMQPIYDRDEQLHAMLVEQNEAVQRAMDYANEVA